MTTTREAIDRIRREFLGSRSEPINKLAVDMIDDTVTLAYDLKGVTEGSRLSIDLETCYVWSANPASRSAVVQRGYESSLATAHPADTLVRVSPMVTDAEILVALNNEIRGLIGDGIYRMADVELHYTPNHATYGLPADCLTVYRVHARDPAEPDGWIRLYGHIFDRNQNLTHFPTGLTMTFTREVPPAGFPFRVTYRKELGSLSSMADVIETTVGTPAIDLLCLGAGMRLTRGRETARNLSDAQGSTRRSQEVPPGAEVGSNRLLQQHYQMELARERYRLATAYPPESGR